MVIYITFSYISIAKKKKRGLNNALAYVNSFTDESILMQDFLFVPDSDVFVKQLYLEAWK
jgi:hypothetical protein